MSSPVIQIPHAPIERRNRSTGEVEVLPVGTLFSPARATTIIVQNTSLVVELPRYTLTFTLPTGDRARHYADIVTRLRNR